MRKIILSTLAAMLVTCITAGAAHTFFTADTVETEPTEISEQTDEPTDEAAEEPADEPTDEATEEPADEPTDEATEEPADEPTDEATEEPTGALPVLETIDPIKCSPVPSAEPTPYAPIMPSAVPETEPTAEPDVEQTAEVTAEPIVEPTAEPAVEPTAGPTAVPSNHSGGSGGSVKKEEITVYMTVEKLTLGEGFICEPTLVTVPDTSTAAYVFDKVMGEGSYKCSGEVEDSIYVSAIRDSETEPQIPPYITAKAGTIGKRHSNEWLGEFDYTNRSGWMYSVNGKFPNISASDYILKDGDVMRWQFTLCGYGSDLDADNRAFGTASIKKLADKSRLIKQVAELRESYKDSVLRSSAAYIAAIDVLERIDSTQDEVNSAYKALSQESLEESYTGSGSGAVKVSASVGFNKLMNDDESVTVTAAITTSAASFSAALDSVTISKLAKDTEVLTVRAADAVITIEQSVFMSLKAMAKDGAVLEVERKENSLSVCFKNGEEQIDTDGVIRAVMPYDAQGYDDCVLVSGAVSYEYKEGRLSLEMRVNEECSVRISPVLRLEDVSPDADYAAALDTLMQRGIIQGAGNDRFEPDADFTTGMLALMLYRERGYEESKGNAWYVKPMEWAVMNGYIIDGDCFKRVNGEILDHAMKTFLGGSEFSAGGGYMTRAEGILNYARYF